MAAEHMNGVAANGNAERQARRERVRAWLDKAIKGGFDPLITCIGDPKEIDSWSLGVGRGSAYGRANRPGAAPMEFWDELFEIMNSQGRVRYFRNGDAHV